jgi:predicted nucleic acid-binding Zn ribbon protein
MNIRQSLLESLPRAFPFAEVVDYEITASGCWLWLGWMDRQGYGRCQIEKLKRATGTARAHRIGWMVLHGSRLHPRTELHHLCHTPRCVNPSHLQPLDIVDHHRRHKYDESTLTEAQVVEMRERAWAGEPLTRLAEQYPVSYKTVHDICHGVTWQDVGGPVGTAPKHCAVCGGEIQRTNTRKAIYCSDRCKTRANYLKNTPHRKRRPSVEARWEEAA